MKKEVDINSIKRAVVFRTDRIGEVLLSSVLIEALKRSLPQAKITFITSSYAKDILSARPDLEEIILFDTIGKRPALRDTLRLASELKSKKFDLAIIVNPHKALHLVAFLAGIPYRLGYNRKWGFLLTHRHEDKRQEGRMHEVGYNLQLLEAIGIKQKDILPALYIKPEDSDYAEKLLERRGISKSKKILAVHPGSSNPAKRWPLENFTSLVKELSKRNDADIILIGDKNEVNICESIAKEAGKGNVFNLAGLLTLGQLSALLKRADLLITNDNGPMHIAAALNRKVIAIFGRNIAGVSPTRWGPCGKGHAVFHKDPGCKPCYDRECPYDFKCLRAITPEEVFSAVVEILK